MGLSLTHFVLSKTTTTPKDRQKFSKKYPHLASHAGLWAPSRELREFRYFIGLDGLFRSLEAFVQTFYHYRSISRTSTAEELIKLPEKFYAKKYKCEQQLDEMFACLLARCPSEEGNLDAILKKLKQELENFYLQLDSEIDHLFEKLDYA